MIQSIGFQFSKSAKQWMAAFAFAAVAGHATVGQAAPASESGKDYYELFSLEELQTREEAARNSGDMQAYYEYDLAERAVRETLEGKRATPHDLPEDFEKNLFSEDNQGNLYRVIDPAGDIDWTEFFISQKTAKVMAEKVESGTVVETVLADGRVETSKMAGPEGGYRVTNPTGERYLVDTAKFESIYDAAAENGVFTPKPDPRKVVSLEENVAFTAPWGSPMYIKGGGVLVHGGVKDIYGIQPDEYAETYSKTEPS